MKYSARIDGLRFVAITLVFCDHFASFFFHRISAGYYGVELFFVISGYLITSILLDSGNTPFGKAYLNFMGRRTLRIFPIYYLMLAILWLLHDPVVHEFLLFALTYTFNYASEYYHITHSSLDHTWSLCVEEQFYLFWPLIVLLLRRLPRVLMAVMIGIVVLGFCQLAFGIFPALSPYNHGGLLSRIPALGIGSLGAIYVRHFTIPDRFFKNLGIELAMIALLCLFLVTDLTIKPLGLAFISLYLILKASKYDFRLQFLSKFLANPRVVYIGTISYGLYLYHLPISLYFSKYIFEPIWSKIPFEEWGRLSALYYHREIIQFPLYSLLSLILAIFSFRYIEKPLLKLKDRFFKKPENPAPSEQKMTQG